MKDNGQLYFINYLNLQEERPKASCAQAAFVLAVICNGQSRGKLLCAQAGLLSTLLRLLAAPGNTPLQGQRDFHTPEAGLLVKWLCLCMGKLTQDMPEVLPCTTFLRETSRVKPRMADAAPTGVGERARCVVCGRGSASVSLVVHKSTGRAWESAE